MLTVADYETIRKCVWNDRLSQREVARRFGHSRHTVKKALLQAAPPGYRRTQEVARPVIEPVQGLIDAWLEEDKTRRRKQRHTAKRIFDRLCEDYDFQGSYSAVQRYVAYKQQTSGETFYPLSFDPGEEVQVDWGEAWAIINGAERKVYLFCMRLCFSTVCFVYAYLRANLESFLDGHRRAFAFFGGVPRRAAYDNLKSAVIEVGKGRERRLNERFRELRSHYLFDSRFCNVASGWEKGHVENLVKHSQLTFMTPPPESVEEAGRLTALNGHLERECLKDLDRLVSGKNRTRRELFEEERRYLLPLPATEFEACKRIHTRVSKQLLVRVDNNDYSAPCQWAHHPVEVKAFVDRLEIFSQDEMIATHQRSYEKHGFVLNPHHYIPMLERKPGGLFNARPFKGEPWGSDFERMRTELEYRYGDEGTKKYIRILLLFDKFEAAQVKEAVRVCVKRRAFNEDAVRMVLTHEPVFRPANLDLSERPDLLAVTGGERLIGVYDALLRTEARP
jgi:transposase